MNNYNNKILRSVADVASKIMSEQLKGNQHKIDANKNKKIDSEDFKILRGEKKVKEEVDLDEEQIDELSQQTLRNYHTKAGADLQKKKEKLSDGTLTTKDHKKGQDRVKGLNRSAVKMEEVDHVDEAAWPDFKKELEKNKTTGNFEKKKISTGTVYSRKHKTETDSEEQDTPKRKVSEMVDLYNEYGLKSISEMIDVSESKDMPTSLHPSHDPRAARFMAMQVAGTGRTIKGKAQSAKQEEPKKEPKMKKEEVEQVEEKVVGEYDDPASRMRKKENEEKRKEREKEKIHERTLTEPEMSKREEVVKSMKKGMQGFKQRYGDRAKNVMYATATKIAKGD
jgi:hypothetical protein